MGTVIARKGWEWSWWLITCLAATFVEWRCWTTSQLWTLTFRRRRDRWESAAGCCWLRAPVGSRDPPSRPPPVNRRVRETRPGWQRQRSTAESLWRSLWRRTSASEHDSSVDVSTCAKLERTQCKQSMTQVTNHADRQYYCGLTFWRPLLLYGYSY